MNKKNFFPKLYPLNKDLSRTWFVKYYDVDGKPQKKFGNLNKLSTILERQIEAKRIVKEILQPEPKEKIEYPKKMLLIQLLSNLLELKKPLLRKKSYQSYYCVISDFARWYRLIKKPHEIDTDYFFYLSSKGLHSNTLRQRSVVLKSFCAELVQRKQLLFNPFENVKYKRKKHTSKLPFNDEQISILKHYFKTYNTQLLLAAEMMYYLFLRPNELRQIRVCDILFNEQKLVLESYIAKDKETIYKKIPNQMLQKFEQFKTMPQHYYLFSVNNEPGEIMIGINKLSNNHREVLKALQIKGRWSFYSWVHTGIKKAALSNIPIKELQLQKGHHDLNMFNQYLKDLGVDDCKQLQNNFPAM